MSGSSYTTDLLNAARLSAVAEGDILLVYLIDMAIERAKDHKSTSKQELAR